MQIHNRELSRREAERWIGNLSQLGGTRHYQLEEGPAKGIRAIDVDTGGGLRFTILPDRGLDISQASYKGVNLVYITANGEVNPAFYESRNSEWQRIFFGGLLTTCGLTYFGPPGRDGEEDLGLHGRYTAIPARNICDRSGWEGDEYRIELSGTIEEAVQFGDKLRLERRISSAIGWKSLIIRDTVTNFGFKPSPYTILYHVNPGFPLLSDAARLVLGFKRVQGIDENSARHLEERTVFPPPQPGFREQVFWYTMANDAHGFGYAALLNRALAGGLGLYLRFSTATLPGMSTWKMVGEGEYVLGMEPCNVFCENRAVLRRKGILPILQPGQETSNEVEIGVLESERQIADFEKKVAALKG